MKTNFGKPLGFILLGVLPILALFAGCGDVSQYPIAPLINPPVAYNFDADAQGWHMPPDSSNPLEVVPVSGEITFGGSPGALKLALLFNNALSANNKTAAGLAFAAGTKDIRGKILSVWIYWAEGDPGASMRVQMYMKGQGKDPGTSFAWANGGEATLVMGKWTQATFITEQPSYRDTTELTFPTYADYQNGLADVRELGVQIYPQNGRSSPVTEVLYIDNYAL